MYSKLTITAPRESAALVTLDALKSELQVTTSEADDYLTALLERVSQTIEAFCCQVFAVEQLEESLRLGGACLEAIVLQRFPVISIASVSVDGVALDAGCFEFDSDAGLLYRLTGDDQVLWAGRVIVVAYTAGFAAVPGPVQQAVFELVKLGQAARTRDPSLRSENILEGLYSYTLFGPGDSVGGMPANVAAMLAPYVNVNIA